MYRVDGAAHLAGGAVEINRHILAGHGDLDPDGDDAGIETVAIDVIREAVVTIRQFGDFGPRPPFRIIQQGVAIDGKALFAVTLRQLDQAPLANAAGCDLAGDIAQHGLGHPHIAFDDAEDRVIPLPRLVQAQGRQAQAFLIDFRGVAGHAARHPAAHVDLVRDAG